MSTVHSGAEKDILRQLVQATMMGRCVRLRSEADDAHVVYFLHGKFVQETVPHNLKHIYDALRAGVIVQEEEMIEEPVAVIDSAAAEDCRMIYRFTFGGMDYGRAFPVWQFEPMP